MKLSVLRENKNSIPIALNVFYECKFCGHLNELVRLPGLGKKTIEMDFNSTEEFDSLCHKCDDIEKITFKLEREWVGLTDEEIASVRDYVGFENDLGELLNYFARHLETKLKEKNT
jgi:hypothetical protein